MLFSFFFFWGGGGGPYSFLVFYTPEPHSNQGLGFRVSGMWGLALPSCLKGSGISQTLSLRAGSLSPKPASHTCNRKDLHFQGKISTYIYIYMYTIIRNPEKGGSFRLQVSPKPEALKSQTRPPRSQIPSRNATGPTLGFRV